MRDVRIHFNFNHTIQKYGRYCDDANLLLLAGRFTVEVSGKKMNFITR